MKLLLTNTGGYPRVGDTPGEQNLRRVIDAWERGQKTDQDLLVAQEAVTKEIVVEQVRAGLDVVTDGQTRWYDPVSHLMRKMKNVKIDGLLRYFDTNFYFRQPVISGKLVCASSLVLEEYLFAQAHCGISVKPVLTGPYTLGRLSLVQTSEYATLGDVVRDLARILGAEISELAANGATIVQLDEPAILKRPEDFPILEAAIGEIARQSGGADLALYVYFGDASPLYEKLLKLPVDVVGLDFTYGPRLVECVLSRDCEKGLGFGLIDGRNTRLEDPEKVGPLLARLLPKAKGRLSYLNPSCGLEYLPRARAREKLSRMVEIAKRYS